MAFANSLGAFLPEPDRRHKFGGSKRIDTLVAGPVMAGGVKADCIPPKIQIYVIEYK
jgi:hypothetical protein